MILDVDTGNDDAVAIVMAAAHPGLELLGCTTVAGNLTLEETTDNTLRILQAIGREDVPVHTGLARPFAPRPYPFEPGRSAGLFHQSALPVGEAGLSPAGTQAVSGSSDAARVHPAGGPCPGRPAHQHRRRDHGRPDILDHRRVVIMGGGWRFGNRTPAAEFNIYADPVAADVVLRVASPGSSWHPRRDARGARQDDVRGYRALGTPAGVAVADVLDFYITATSPPPMGGRTRPSTTRSASTDRPGRVDTRGSRQVDAVGWRAHRSTSTPAGAIASGRGRRRLKPVPSPRGRVAGPRS